MAIDRSAHENLKYHILRMLKNPKQVLELPIHVPSGEATTSVAKYIFKKCKAYCLACLLWCDGVLLL